MVNNSLRVNCQFPVDYFVIFIASIMIFVIFMMIEGIIEHGVVKARICYERKQRSVADTLTPKNRVLTQSTSGKIFFLSDKSFIKGST